MILNNIDQSIFRAYDIRGIVGETLNEKNVFLIGKGIGSLVLAQKEQQVTIARDGRESGFKLSQSLTEGILSTGCDVIDIGMVPTPLLYYATRIFDQHSGVMLTGSHNPPEYNGLKIVIGGQTLAEEGLQILYKRITQNEFNEGKGNRYVQDVVDRYINAVKHSIRLTKPLKIVVDAGNGVTGIVAPLLFRALGCEVDELFCEIDGRFPNHHPDPTQPENLSALFKVMREGRADIGFAFDGDGDRLGLVTNRGELIHADRVLMLFSQALLKQHPGAKIIFDVKCSNQLADLIVKNGGEPLMWKTGHSLIKVKLQETNALLAGEMSGHFFFKDRWFGFDDALYAGARMLELLSHDGNKSAVLFDRLPNSINTPELRVSVNEEEKFSLMKTLIEKAKFEQAKEIVTLDGLRVVFDKGWGLVRASNTTPCLILRFEANNHEWLHHIQKLFRELLLSIKPDLVLPF